MRLDQPEPSRNHSAAEKRGEERIPISLAVTGQRTRGITHDVSASGMYILTDDTLSLGERLALNVHFDNRGGALTWECTSKVVRLELCDGKVGAAVSIVHSSISNAD